MSINFYSKNNELIVSLSNVELDKYVDSKLVDKSVNNGVMIYTTTLNNLLNILNIKLELIEYYKIVNNETNNLLISYMLNNNTIILNAQDQISKINLNQLPDDIIITFTFGIVIDEIARSTRSTSIKETFKSSDENNNSNTNICLIFIIMLLIIIGIYTGNYYYFAVVILLICFMKYFVF